jgi:hypothetical protein
VRLFDQKFTQLDQEAGQLRSLAHLRPWLLGNHKTVPAGLLLGNHVPNFMKIRKAV